MVALLGTLSASTTTHAYSLTSFEWNEAITLKLVDGRSLEGNYRGSLGSTPSAIAFEERYETWRQGLGATSAPALGESLLVTRGGGAPVRGGFRGFAESALLLGTADSCTFLVVPLDGKTDVRRIDEPSMGSDWIAARELWKSAPAPSVLVLKAGKRTVAVPTSMIASQSSRPSPGHGFTGGLLVGVLLGAIAGWAASASAYGHAP
jgi:hypothetical protein